MQTSPANAHRVPGPLVWTRQPGNGLHVGDVMNQLAADGSLGLHAQPRGGRYKGVSFFVPSSSEVAAAALAVLGEGAHGCAITTPGAPLPEHLCFVCDGDLSLPAVDASGHTEPVLCGQHWTLHTSANSSVNAFEAAYAQVLQHCVPCQPAAQAMPLDVDLDYLPGDRMTLAAVLALDDFVANSDDFNTKLFGSLYAWHLRATDMKFEEVVAFTPIAYMVAAALDAWTVTDPFLWAHVRKARDLLSEELSFKFSELKYKPFWVSRA